MIWTAAIPTVMVRADGNQVNSEANTLSYAMSDAGVTVNLMTASASGGHATDDTIATYEELRPTDGR